MNKDPNIQFDKLMGNTAGSGRTGGLRRVLIIVAVVLVVLFVIGFVPRLVRVSGLRQMHKETVDAIPVVHVIVAKPAPDQESMLLPANIGAIQYATIYARVSGYLKSRLVDIGDHVKTGQLLAVIDTPTVDQELAQARADFAQAQASLSSAQAALKEAIAQDVSAQAEVEKATTNLAYADVTAKRWVSLASRGSVSQQSRDEKVCQFNAATATLAASKAQEKAALAQVYAAQANVNVAVATVKAKVASVKRYEAEQSFQKVLAPFDGIITLRKVDPGALITAGSQSTSLELFQMAKIDTLRVYIRVPQRFARYLRTGMQADVLVPEFPDRTFKGEITNVAGALDPSSRTLQTEIHIPNSEHVLLPGMYASVRVTGLREQPWIHVPGTCLVVRPDGQYVVAVKDGKAHYQLVEVGRDFGNEVEIRRGLIGNEQVVVSPQDDLREGDAVQAELTPQQQ